MKIAIVAPCPVPFMVGGAERLWWGLARHLNERTGHPTEIIKLPAPEGGLAELLRSYEAFSTLDLDAFDMVISGKYPAWMVGHRRHVCYMLHRLRGLYDCYFGAPAFDAQLASHPAVASLRTFMSRARESRSALPEFFGRWNELLVGERPPGLLDFPGPLAREIVQWLDGIALSPDAISRYAAISRTVAEREGYFPPGVEVGVAHPPPHQPLEPGERFEHFYTVSRLDHIKRVGMVVEAMRHVKGTVPLVVGGTGPEEAAVRALAGDDARIRFVGFQGDAEVRENYRNALAVPFVPWHEDYGLVAIEAMQAGKPVITARDSGGPCELVEDGVTGLICEDNAQSLAQAMQRMVDDVEGARAMGRAGREHAGRVTWDAVVTTLLGSSASRTRPKAVRKLVVASTFPIHPPRHGGQVRSFQIYRALAPEFETVIVSAVPAEVSALDHEIAPGVREVRVPLSAAHQKLEREMQERMGTPVTDVMIARLHALSPALERTLREEAADACALVASHPYFYPVLREIGLPIWYEAQDLELHLKRKLFEPLPGGDELVETVQTVEGECARAAEVILCASPHDADALVEEYGVQRECIEDVANGTDAERIAFAGPAERQALRGKLEFGDTRLALFMGSGHWPNIEAVRRIFEFAVELPSIAFVVMGSVCYAFDPTLKPGNVLFLGEVDDVTRNLCLHACDVALNPMEHGSGTNIKMLDYFAAGLPVITSPSGARGLPLDDERYCLVRTIAEFPTVLQDSLGLGAEACARRAAAARRLVEERFDWHTIVQRVKPRLVGLADAELARRALTGRERLSAA